MSQKAFSTRTEPATGAIPRGVVNQGNSFGVVDAPNQPPGLPLHPDIESFATRLKQSLDDALVNPPSSKRGVGARAAGIHTPRLEYRTHCDRFPRQLSSEPLDGPHWSIHAKDFGAGLVEVACVIHTEPARKPHSPPGKKVVKKHRELSPESIERSNRRAKRDLRHKILMLEADRLLTLTIRDNITDRDIAYQYLRKWTRMIKRVMPSFQWVAVLEFQKRGAFHWHLAIRGHRNVNVLRFYWWKVVGEGMGNVDITKPRRGTGQWKRSKLAFYLAKYIGKDIDHQLANTKRYSSSQGIAKPDRTTYYMALGDSPGWIVSNILYWLTSGRICRAVLDVSDGGRIAYWGTT